MSGLTYEILGITVITFPIFIYVRETEHTCLGGAVSPMDTEVKTCRLEGKWREDLSLSNVTPLKISCIQKHNKAHEVSISTK